MVHYGGSGEAAQEVVQKITALGVQAVAVQSDATSKDFGTTLVNAVSRDEQKRLSIDDDEC